MSSRSGSSNNVALIFGGISLLSLAGLCLYLYKGKKVIDHKNFKEHKPNATEKAASREDEDEEDEEGSSESIRKAEEAALKEAYDQALGLAK
jgi:LPXTG-motif cell wall-anchored protein